MAVEEQIDTEMVIKARYLMKLVSMVKVAGYKMSGKVKTLAPFWRGGLCYTRGRMGESALKVVLVVGELVVLLSIQNISWLIMKAAYEKDHHDYRMTLARSRTKVWILLGYKLAHRILSLTR